MNLGNDIYIGLPRISNNPAMELFEMQNNTVDLIIWNPIYNLVNIRVYSPILRTCFDYEIKIRNL